MKNIFLAFSLLIPALAMGQDVVDTSYTSLRFGYNAIEGDSIWYETLTVQYTDGRQEVTETVLGDSTTAIDYFFNRATQAGRRFASAANEVWQKKTVIDFILNANSVLSSVFDTSIIAISVERYGPAIDSTNWTITAEGIGILNGELTVNGNTLKMQVGATAYTLLPAGDAWIRFQNFPAGSFTDLHRKKGGKLEYRSVDQSLIMKIE